MNLLFSEIDDPSTNYVIDWFIYMNEKYIRYNGKAINNLEFDLSRPSFNFEFGTSHNNSKVTKNEKELNDLKSIWYRRPYKGIGDIYESFDSTFKGISQSRINQLLKKHNTILKDFTIDHLESNTKNVLGSYQITGLNKPKILLLAKQIGLDIPNTQITNSLEDVRSFFLKNDKKIICKALHEGVGYYQKSKNKGHIQYTTLITSLNELPKVFAYTLFQEYIEKEFEIRVVYINGEIFPMAIFNQLDKTTVVDFRKTNPNKATRMVPYLLNKLLMKKLNKLMKSLNLNMASIDLIKSKDNTIYFLEINPVGQYDFTSKSCNYNLDYKIAKYLVDGK